MRPSLFTHMACAAVLAAAACSAQAAPDAQFVPAFQSFLLASEGQDAALASALAGFGALSQAEPASPVLLAYRGAATAMQARTTYLPWRKMAYAEDGLALLDKALAMLQPAHDAPGQRQIPAVLDVKLVAANTFLALPAMMNRRDRGVKLLGEVARSPLLPSAPPAFQESVRKALDKARLAPDGKARP
ncbi:MAG: hypothetical protein ABT02_06590 [Comamonadaceae bacterium SCN 68-20]|nr:MAG: hypothetical protein ABT02_06590 [Comamonadaceae bacterium SCN 68-20]OJX31272.1 MAG: hypothetical protein BGO75_18155 [Burkholderiales bacterium 68-20]